MLVSIIRHQEEPILTHKQLADLQAGWKYVLENFPEVDPDRAVAAGASYGGYAIKYACCVFRIQSPVLTVP